MLGLNIERRMTTSALLPLTSPAEEGWLSLGIHIDILPLRIVFKSAHAQTTTYVTNLNGIFLLQKRVVRAVTHSFYLRTILRDMKN